MTTVPTASPSPDAAERAAPFRHEEDLELVRRILAGESAAWTLFVERHSGLISAMIRRYLRSRDPDDVRTVFTNVLESLWKTRLRAYEGRASLSTWVVLVTRCEVTDHLRRTFGRDPKMKALQRLTPAERLVFRLYYIEGQTQRDVLERLATTGEHWSGDDLLAVLRRVEETLGERWLKRLAYDLHARSVGATSGRLLEYLDHLRDELEQREGALRPEYEIMQQEARRTLDRLRLAMQELDPGDQRVLQLRFEHGWTARRIASELGLGGQRRVYSTIERLVNGLRRRLLRDGVES